MISLLQCWLLGVKGDTGDPGIRGPRGLIGKVCLHTNRVLKYKNTKHAFLSTSQ